MSDCFDTTVGRISVVSHDSDGNVNVWIAPDRPHFDLLETVLICFRGWDENYYHSPLSSEKHPLPPPSETLLSLLRSFHEHRAAYAVVDRLIEEYPQLEPYLAGVVGEVAAAEEVVS